ncbi:CD2-associated protein isoform X1 [Oryzias latipes]|uniref:Osteoclast-stimulating factor 1 n=1 Tax=Oryzias latipes TaxID=8090 RepID=H2MLK1_ORYLA|nr:CD2-associated protein isoform X1 [Oryzias latipes]
MEVLVEFDYEALHDDELTLRPGDVIRNVRYIEEDGWMEGDLNGKRGVFPDNFVKEIKKEKEPKEVKETKHEPKEETSVPQKREKSAHVANLVQRMSTIGFPTGGFQPPTTVKKPKKRHCKVLFDYQPQNEDELELKKGDLIEITEEVEEGWWSGSLNGKSGLFPSNFVKEMDAAGEDVESSDATPDDAEGSGTDGATTPTSPQSASGSGAIAQPKKVQRFGYGDIFKESSFKLKPVPSLPSSAKPTPPNTTEPPRAEADAKLKDASVSVPSAKEFCRVMFAFEGTHEDELSLKEGDIVQILSKDTGETGWWRGEIGGERGVFPDNFVVVISETERESLMSRGSIKSSPKQELDPKRKKPPPPTKATGPRPDIPFTDRKPHPIKPEEKVERPSPDIKTHKPAPVVPPKKPLPPGKNKPASFPPKRPEKTFVPSASFRENGEVSSSRQKPEVEPLAPSKPKPLAGNMEEKPPEGTKDQLQPAPQTQAPPASDLMSFDDLSAASEKLSHPTANRPKMLGRRPPTQFVAEKSPTKDTIVEKFFRPEDEEAAKPKLTETRKPSINSLSPLLSRPAEAKAAPATSPGVDANASQSGKARLEPEEPNAQLEDLRGQIKDLLLTVELLKVQQTKEISELRVELDEERLKRLTLQMEIEKLKKAIHLT